MNTRITHPTVTPPTPPLPPSGGEGLSVSHVLPAAWGITPGGGRSTTVPGVQSCSCPAGESHGALGGGLRPGPPGMTIAEPYPAYGGHLTHSSYCLWSEDPHLGMRERLRRASLGTTRENLVYKSRTSSPGFPKPGVSTPPLLPHTRRDMEVSCKCNRL